VLLRPSEAFALTIFFVTEGLVNLVAYFRNRSAIGSGQLLFL
jgi:hypothetical protein